LLDTVLFRIDALKYSEQNAAAAFSTKIRSSGESVVRDLPRSARGYRHFQFGIAA
jgi:hypothetical protein